MKLLVLAEQYSTNEKISQGFIHTRNVAYKKEGIDLDVISFSYNGSHYNYEGIDVYSQREFDSTKKIEEYDIVISHAPNIKHHCKFINKNNNKIKKIVFFFHGHEILYSKEIYPKPYYYVKKDNIIKETVRHIYDCFKIIYMRKFLKKHLNKAYFIFVSDWMYSEFEKNIKIELPNKRKYIIYNALGDLFLKNNYSSEGIKKYDYITIRNMLDGSKYCIDLVNSIAKNNPNKKFLVIGLGSFFDNFKKSPNVKVIYKNLTHEEIINYLNQSSVALMLTRADAQGVMMCEMAAFGIKLITSDIPVCHQVLGDVSDVAFISNNDICVDLEKVTFNNSNKFISAKKKFSTQETTNKEISVLKEIR